MGIILVLTLLKRYSTFQYLLKWDHLLSAFHVLIRVCLPGCITCICNTDILLLASSVHNFFLCSCHFFQIFILALDLRNYITLVQGTIVVVHYYCPFAILIPMPVVFIYFFLCRYFSSSRLFINLRLKELHHCDAMYYCCSPLLLCPLA